MDARATQQSKNKNDFMEVLYFGHVRELPDGLRWSVFKKTVHPSV